MIRLGMIALLCSSVAACGKGDKTPGGQTVATVNGEDITQSELNLEMASAGVNPQNKAEAQSQVLQSMIDRKLIVQQATKDGLDKSPEFILAERRAHEMLLAQRAMQTAAAGSRPQPTESEINAYLDKNPNIGEGRKLLVVDQLKFAAPRSAAEAEAFKPIHTMDALVAMLTARGQPMQRTQSEIDTATMPNEALVKFRSLPPGEPLVVIQGPVAVANVIIGERPAAGGSSMQGAQIAKQRIQQDQMMKSLQARQASLRKDAKIDYADGYKPKPPAAGAKPGTPAPAN